MQGEDPIMTKVTTPSTWTFPVVSRCLEFVGTIVWLSVSDISPSGAVGRQHQCALPHPIDYIKAEQARIILNTVLSNIILPSWIAYNCAVYCQLSDIVDGLSDVWCPVDVGFPLFN